MSFKDAGESLLVTVCRAGFFLESVMFSLNEVQDCTSVRFSTSTRTAELVPLSSSAFACKYLHLHVSC